MSAPPTTPRERSPRARVVRRVGFVLLLVGPVLLRLHASSPLWLDEALSVNIARLPLPALFAALREDGSPPLYYLALHGWIALFGTGDAAVRSLSSVFSLLALMVAYPVGRRVAGPTGGPAAVLLLAASPFAIRYATETRMYALVMLWALLGVWAVLRALDRPTAGRLAAVSLVVAGLTLTHYWTFFFVAAAELTLLVLLLRAHVRHDHEQRRAALRVAVAVPAGMLLFLPWAPTFLFQLRHTGTPWEPPPSWSAVATSVGGWSGPGTWGIPLTALLVVLVALALRLAVARTLLAVALGTLLLGIGVSQLQGSGFAVRYSATVLLPFLLVATAGVVRLRDPFRSGALALAVVLGLSVALWSPLLATRTQAAQTAAALRSGLATGDLVVYCPDQLGPAIDRLLPAGVDEVVYPTMAPPQLIDWIDYAARNAAASPTAFARAASARTDAAVWLVRSDGYRTFGNQCAELESALTDLRGSPTVVQAVVTSTDAERLVRFRPPAGS